MMSLMQRRDFQPSDMTISIRPHLRSKMNCLQKYKSGKGRKSFKTFMARGESIIPANCRDAINNKLVSIIYHELTEAKILDGAL